MLHPSARALAVLAASILLAASVKSARASEILDFSYTDGNGDTISGTMDGALQSDDDTFLVTGMGPITFDGGATAPLNFVASIDDYQSLGNGYMGEDTAAVTLDGSYMDLIACFDSDCADGFLFAVGDEFSGNFDGSLFSGGASFGFVFEPFNPQGWSASVAPEPQSFVLFGLGLAGLAASRRFLAGRNPLPGRGATKLAATQAATQIVVPVR